MNIGNRTVMFHLRRIIKATECLQQKTTRSISLVVRNQLFFYDSATRNRSLLKNVNVNGRNETLVKSELNRKMRNLSSSRIEDSMAEGETRLKNTIRKHFPKATNITVEDISGGCGSMYQIYIEAPDFKGLSLVKQHKLVNKALTQEIKSMHGIRIQTAVPKSGKGVT